jgi:hypothetical protein
MYNDNKSRLFIVTIINIDYVNTIILFDTVNIISTYSNYDS